MTGPNFKAAREASGYSAARFAHIMGVEVQAVKRWETGSRKVPQIAANLLRWIGNGFKPEEFEK